MHYLYLSIHNNAAALQQEREALVAWCEENGIKEYGKHPTKYILTK